MAPLGGVVRRLLYEFEQAVSQAHDADEAFGCLQQIVDQLHGELVGGTARVAEQFARRFKHWHRTVVISYSSQVVAALRALRKRTLEVVVCESRPALEGRRTARLLLDHAKSVTVITEARIAAAVEACNGVLLGCDAIHRDGSIVNKSGSYLLALAAREKKRRVVVLGDRFKITDDSGPQEHHPANEVWKNAPAGIRIENSYFERVPRGLINTIVLEDGVYKPPDIKRLWQQERKRRA